METYGTLHLHDWIQSPRGQVKCLRGNIEIVADADHVGFKARGSNSANWLAVVSGENETWHMFGCQVRCITEHLVNAPPIVDCYEVT